MRTAFPGLVAELDTAAVGDRVAETLADLHAGIPTPSLVNRARVRWGARTQDEALQVVLTLWGRFAPDLPAPNGRGEVAPAP